MSVRSCHDYMFLLLTLIIKTTVLYRYSIEISIHSVLFGDAAE